MRTQISNIPPTSVALDPDFKDIENSASLHLRAVSAVRGHKPLFSQLSLNCALPEIIWVCGANGTGKTTLLNICAGLSRPDEGHVVWTLGGVDTPAAQIISYLPAQGFAKRGLTLAEDFNFWSDLNAVTHISKPSPLALTVLEKHKSTRTQNLSTGQKKRLGLARLIADQKPIWILDEPMAGLDVQGRAFFIALVTAHIGRGGIAIIASHNPIAIDAMDARQITLTAQAEDTQT